MVLMYIGAPQPQVIISSGISKNSPHSPITHIQPQYVKCRRYILVLVIPPLILVQQPVPLFMHLQMEKFLLFRVFLVIDRLTIAILRILVLLCRLWEIVL